MYYTNETEAFDDFRDAFDDINNDFLESVLGRDQNPSLPPRALMNTISSVSNYYPYTNPPPMGYGTPAPKVAESVNRAWKYNLKPENERTHKIGKYTLNKPYWEKGPYPVQECMGNFMAFEATTMFTKFLYKNKEHIIECTKNTINKALQTNANVLTQGRQTWDAFQEKSIPCPLAYRRMESFMTTNEGTQTMNCLDFISRYNRLKTRDKLIVTRSKKLKMKRYKYNVVSKRREVRIISRTCKVTEEISGVVDNENLTQVRDFLREVERSFCSYIKHGERAKLNRRAIASANVILRMYLYIIEDFHLELGKVISGSTISIGGEEKKKKITTELCQAETVSQGIRDFKLQSTQDATKWNECLSADLFALFHMVLYSDAVRQTLGFPLATEHEKLFRDICLHGHYILAIKKIALGESPIMKGEGTFNRPDWNEITPDRLNNTFRAVWEEMHPHRHGMYLEASPGMLMGMHNALSTTVALAAVGYGTDDYTSSVATLRSSDDSTTAYYGKNIEYVRDAILYEILGLKLLGINMSLDKTFYFRYNYSEYTSWYMDSKFMAQYGVETSSLRPQGKNPPDDLYSLVIGAALAQQRLEINCLGAEAKIRIGTDNCRRLWKIKHEPNKRPGISGDVLMFADGGNVLYNSGLCHLEETSLKMLHVTNDIEKEYLQKIRNPDHPFSAPLHEDISYSVDLGKLTTSFVETPRTLFHYVKRTNRTNRGKGLGNQIAVEKHYTEAVKIVETTDVTTMLRAPSSSMNMASYITSLLRMYKSGSEMNEELDEKYRVALARLSGQYDEDNMACNTGLARSATLYSLNLKRGNF